MERWPKRSAAQRALVLYRFARALRDQTRTLARLVAEESGLPIAVGRTADAGAAAESVLHYAGWADKLPHAFAGRELRPAGVVRALVDGPLPLARLASIVAPALACANTVVVSAVRTPRAAQRFVELARDAGIGDGALEIDEVTERDHTALGRADVLAYRGPAGGALGFAATETHRTTVVTDGKISHLVFPDASLDAAVEGILAPVSLAGGEGGAGSRVFVAEAVADELLRRLRARLAHLRTGNPLDPTTDVGPVEPGERAHLDALLEDAASLGGIVIRSAAPAPEGEIWFAPAVIAEAVLAHRAVTEPYRGALVPVVTFRTPDEAIAQANHLPSHAGVTVWTSPGATALYAARELRVRNVWCGVPERVERAAALQTLRAYLA